MPFSPAQIDALRSLLDRLIPKDEEPSACEAGVDGFVLELLAGDGKAMADNVSQGLRSLDELAQSRRQRPFADLAPAEQDSLIEAADPAFVGRMADLAAQGYYGRPAR